MVVVVVVVVGERKKSPTPFLCPILSIKKLRGNGTLTQKKRDDLVSSSFGVAFAGAQSARDRLDAFLSPRRLIRRGWISRIGDRWRNKICPIDDRQSGGGAFTHHLYRLCEKHVHQCNLLDSSDENASRGSKVGV